MEWNDRDNKRSMPWKGERNPYFIWLSEIILQQTRVEQGLAYYNRFIKNYPTIDDLANASDVDVFKDWEGLGYYARCRNLLATARTVKERHSGIFPNTYEQILALKGIGPYTAAAIASFAFHQPHAVLDGNVFRVLARFFGITIPIDSNNGKKEFSKIANEVLDKKLPAKFNQAIMDFGAIICTPMLPSCSTCVLSKECIAHNKLLTATLPVKTKTLEKKKRNFNYFVFHANGLVFVQQRNQKDIWHSLFEFYLFESDKPLKWDKISVRDYLHNQLNIQDFNLNEIIKAQPQTLTHRVINGVFLVIDIINKNNLGPTLNGKWVSAGELDKLPFPVFIKRQTDHLKNMLNGF